MRMSIIEWLLDSDPSIRWQVMRDLIAESDATVARERSRVAAEGWGLACWTFKDRLAIGAARHSYRTPGSPPRTRSGCCDPGPVHFEMEGRAGEPSRRNTLRALRVLRWASAWSIRRPGADTP